MEEGTITVSRLNQTVVFPAQTMIAAAMNPCKCGFFPDLGKCRCTQAQIRRYLNRVSGPFLDRIDIGVEVPRQNLLDPAEREKRCESSASMRARVLEARARQEERFLREAISYNSQMNRSQMEEFCALSRLDRIFLEEIESSQGISARGHGKLLKTARTLADLDGRKEIGRAQIAEAVAFRSFEQKYWGSL